MRLRWFYNELTKWLSQCGQYSSDSSKTDISFLKALLHFLHIKANSKDLANGWSSFSSWHSGHWYQIKEEISKTDNSFKLTSNHFLQQGDLIAAWALSICLLL